MENELYKCLPLLWIVFYFFIFLIFFLTIHCWLFRSWWTDWPISFHCVFFVCVQVSSVRVRVPAACGSSEVSTDLSLRGESQRSRLCWCFYLREIWPCAACVHSEGWSDPHSTCPVSVATNWISSDSQCWASGLLAADGLFNINVAFSGSAAGAHGELQHSPRSWCLQLTSDSDPLFCCVSVDLFFFPFWVPHFLFAIYLFTTPPERRACPHFNSAEVKRWRGWNEVSWF